MVPESEGIYDASDDCLADGELGSQPEGEEHHKKQDGPNGRNWKTSHSLGIGHKSKTSTWREVKLLSREQFVFDNIFLSFSRVHCLTWE